MTLRLVVWGTAELSEYPRLAGVGDIPDEDLTHVMDPGDGLTLDCPVEIEVREA